MKTRCEDSIEIQEYKFGAMTAEGLGGAEPGVKGLGVGLQGFNSLGGFCEFIAMRE